MSSNSSANTNHRIEFKPRPSVLLARLLLLMHGSAALVVFLFIHHKIAMAVLLLLIGYSYYRSYRKHILHRGSGAVRRIVWQADGAWYLEDQAGVMREARLRPSSYVHPRLVILNFELLHSKGRPTMILCPDSMDADTLRRIRSRLRVRSAGAREARYTKA